MGLYIKIPDVTFKNYIGIAEVEDDPCQHEYDEGVVTTAPTCVDAGVMTYTCALCGHTYTEDIPATGEHTYADGVCSVCGNVDVPTTYPETDPETDTLKGLFYLGGNQTDSLYNHAVEGGGTAEIPSTASVDFSNANYATFSGGMKASRITTRVITAAPENGVTMVALFRVPTGNRSIVSAYQTSANKGFVFGNDRSYAYVDGSGGQRYYDAAVNSNNFAICAFYAGPNGLRVVKSGNDGAVSEIYQLDGALTAWTASAGITIGGGQTSVSFEDTADIALVSIHEGDMTDAQLQHIFRYVRYYGESKGLTIE